MDYKINTRGQILRKEHIYLKTDELLAAAARVEDCDAESLVADIVTWAEEEINNPAIYDTLNTVAYTILEHCDIN